jgi:hypothetical protein
MLAGIGPRMAGFALRKAVLVLALALAGCVLPGGGGPGAKSGAANPVTGDAIEVTALDDLPAAAAPDAKPAAGLPSAKPGPDDPRPRPRPAKPAPPAADPVAPPVAAPAVPEAAKTPGQIACERKKGIWSKAGKGGFSCISKTRDAGKECRAAKDCEGLCLARSGTCAPFKPLFGCNEILDDMGRRMTLCID